MLKKIVLGLLVILFLIITTISYLFNGYEVKGVTGELILFTKENRSQEKYKTGIMTKEGSILYGMKYEIKSCNNLLFLSTEEDVIVIHKDRPTEIIKKLENTQDNTILGYNDYCFIYGTEEDYLFSQLGEVVKVDANYDFYGLYEEKGNLFKLSRGIVIDENSKYGYINQTGTTIIQPQYDLAYNFTSNGFAIVMKDHHYGVIDEAGNIVIDIQYDTIQYANSLDYYIVEKNSRVGYLNTKGETIIPMTYSTLSPVTNDLIIASQSGMYGVINLQEEVIIDFMYQTITHPVPNYFVFKQDNRYGVMNDKGNVLVNNVYEDIQLTEDYRKRNFLAAKLDHWGLITFQGKVLIDFKYDHFGLEENFIYARSTNNLLVLFDYLGNQKNEIAYDSLNGRIVEANNLHGLVSEAGDEMIKPKYESLEMISGRYYIAIQDQYGVIYESEQIIYNFEYDRVLKLNNDELILIKNGEIYKGDLTGEITKIKRKFHLANIE